MKYEIAKLKATEFANKRGNPVYIAKSNKLKDYEVIFDFLGLSRNYSVVEMVKPS
jgi:hypothetical protein